MTTVEAEKKTTRSVEEIKAELTQAREAFNKLKREQAEIPQRLKDEAAADQDALTQAALSGSLKGAKTPKLDSARARRDELPYLTWAASIRALSLEEELVERQRAEIEAQLPELRSAVEEAEAAFEEARENLAVARNEHASLLEELRDTDRGRRQRQGRLSQLQENGPEGI